MLAAKPQTPRSKSAPSAEKTKSSAQPPAVTAFNPAWSRLALSVQPKLRVSAPGDPAEVEADRIAETVMRMPQPVVQRKCAARSAGGAPCPNCEEEMRVQRKEDGTRDAGEVDTDFASRLGGGTSLDAGSRAFFEPRIGQDLSNVRLHTDAAAAASAQAVNALAYTVGHNIVFGAGQYQPQQSTGRRLIAHELAHVVQQRTSPARAQSGHFRLFREAISLRSSHRITDTTPGGADNRREEVLDLLDRLHVLWSIDNNNYNNQHTYISALPAGAQVPQTDAAATPPWSFQPTMDAIRRTREPTLAGPVINHYMSGLAVSDHVGRGLMNNKADVLAVQDRLNYLTPYPAYAVERAAAVLALTMARVPDWMLGGTFGAITDFKIGIASGDASWPWFPLLQTQMHSQTLGIDDPYGGPTSVSAHYFPGRTDRRALIVGGVHNLTERQGAVVVDRLRTLLTARIAATPSRPPFFTTILVPSLFAPGRYNTAQGDGRWIQGGMGLDPGGALESSRFVEPNRNFPLPGEDLAAARARGSTGPTAPELVFRPSASAAPRPAQDTSGAGHGGTSIRMLPETRTLIALIEHFHPERIASVHAHSLKSVPGDAPGIFVDPRGVDPTTGAVTNAAQAAEDGRLATAMVREGRSRLAPAPITGVRSPDPFVGNAAGTPRSTVRYASGAHAEGNSFGMWAPAPVTSGPGARAGITTMTIEVPQWRRPAEATELSRLEDLDRDLLADIFLEDPTVVAPATGPATP